MEKTAAKFQVGQIAVLNHSKKILPFLILESIWNDGWFYKWNSRNAASEHMIRELTPQEVGGSKCENCADLETLFEMQQKRMRKATKLWQEATGKHEVFPDLGNLLDWLIERAPSPAQGTPEPPNAKLQRKLIGNLLTRWELMTNDFKSVVDEQERDFYQAMHELVRSVDSGEFWPEPSALAGPQNGQGWEQQLKDIRAALDDALDWLRTRQYDNVGVAIKQAMHYVALPAPPTGDAPHKEGR